MIFRSLVLLLSLSCSLAHGQVTALRSRAVVDPQTATLVEGAIILIEGGKISRVGADLQIPADAQVLDYSSSFVLPALMDAHTHLMASIDPKWDIGDFWVMAVQRRAGYRAILGARYAREMLEAGFTTVRDLGNAGDYLDMDLEKAIRRGYVPGPTIIPAGRIIAPYGGQFWAQPDDRSQLEHAEYYFADSTDELRKAIRENIYWGAKVIKVVVDSQRYQYSVDDLRFMVAEAAAAGVKVAAHAQTQRGARAAIEAKVASVEHGWVLADEDLALARKNGVVLVSTDFTTKQLLANGFELERAQAIHARRVERLRRAHRAGVTIVFGTDIMNNLRTPTRGAQALEYIDSFVEAEVPAATILRAMTTEAAKLFGLEGERGRIEEGLAADLIAVRENPLDNIHTLRDAVLVIRNGTVVRQQSGATLE